MNRYGYQTQHLRFKDPALGANGFSEIASIGFDRSQSLALACSYKITLETPLIILPVTPIFKRIYSKIAPRVGFEPTSSEGAQV